MSETFNLAVRVIGRGELLIDGGTSPADAHRLEVVACGHAAPMRLNFTIPAAFYAPVGATLTLSLTAATGQAAIGRVA